MTARNLRPATLVVIEYGGSWPRWLEPGQPGDTAVVAQHYEGHPSSLLTQVASRLTRLEAMGWCFDAIVLVSNGRADTEACAARSVLARGLMARLKSLYSANFVLSVDETLGRKGIHALIGLAAALDGNLPPSIELGVRIGSGPPIYGSTSSRVPIARAS
jgi:hypothetical protein